MAILGWSSPTFNISSVLRICSCALYPGCFLDLKPLLILLALQQPRLLSPDDHRLVIDTSCSSSASLSPCRLALTISVTSCPPLIVLSLQLVIVYHFLLSFHSAICLVQLIIPLFLLSCSFPVFFTAQCLRSPYSISFPFLSSFIIRHHNFTHTLYGTSHCPSLTGLRSLSP